MIGGLKWHPNHRDRASDDLGPLAGRRLLAGRDHREVERWTNSETGGLNAQQFAEPELVKWKSFDDREISGFLHHPPGKFTGNAPVIVMIHGGPEGQSRPAFLSRNNYFIDELGVAVIHPNVRGSSGYGKSFLQLDNGLLREGIVPGHRGPVRLDRHPRRSGRRPRDGDRRSYGGHMTLAVATRYSDRIRCSLDVVGSRTW